ncbi:MAG: hypothetical protein LBQ73_03500 [Tannerellaceae bacterium]|nr:hypothetical protein [Tannerellaceae bacterium]
MNITLFAKFRHNEGTVPLGSVLEKIQNGFYAGSIQPLREAVESGDGVKAGALKKALPAFTLSAVYSGRRVADSLTHYNGAVILDVDNVARDVLTRAGELPHTLFCFRSPGGNGLKIGVQPSVSHPLMELPPPAEAAKKLQRARKMTTRKMGYTEGNLNNYVFLFDLNCAHNGPGFEETFNYCLENFPDLPKEEVRTTVQSAYRSVQIRENGQTSLQENEGLIVTIESYLKNQFYMRYNVVTRRVEYQEKGHPAPFEPLDDRMENTIWCDLLKSNIECRQNGLNAVLYSKFSPPFDPLRLLFLFPAFLGWIRLHRATGADGEGQQTRAPGKIPL